jgi:hypothetical protein
VSTLWNSRAMSSTSLAQAFSILRQREATSCNKLYRCIGRLAAVRAPRSETAISALGLAFRLPAWTVGWLIRVSLCNHTHYQIYLS